MENKNTSGNSCMTMEKTRRLQSDYAAELRTWVQQVILEAEKSNNSKKKNQYLNLLETF